MLVGRPWLSFFIQTPLEIYKRSGQYGKYLAYLAARPVLTGQFVARKAISVIFSRV